MTEKASELGVGGFVHRDGEQRLEHVAKHVAVALHDVSSAKDRVDARDLHHPHVVGRVEIKVVRPLGDRLPVVGRAAVHRDAVLGLDVLGGGQLAEELVRQLGEQSTANLVARLQRAAMPFTTTPHAR